MSESGPAGTTSSGKDPGSAFPRNPTTGGSDIFGASSVWRAEVSTAPVSKDSGALVSELVGQVEATGGTASFNDYQYDVRLYTVSGAQTTADVIFDDCQNKGYVPSQLYEAGAGAVFSSVPIPDDAQPATGTDGELSIYQPSSDTLWELWQANHQADGWHACWGGRLDDVSQSPGYFANNTGVAATGLSVTGGAIGLEEASAGRIDHAMSLNVMHAANYSSFSFPAQGSDGDLAPGTFGIPEGQRFRLDPTIDVAALGLSPVAESIASAAQTYGFIVNDKGGAVAVIAVEQPQLAAEGLTWGSVLGDAPSYDVLRGFPWHHLEALPFDYGK